MTTPRTASKVLVLSSPRVLGAGPAAMPLRRFRIARLRLDGRQASGDPRFGHLKRS
jgi:hypothetical protein